MRHPNERGFTMIELMIAIFLVSILSVGFYQVMFSSVRGSDTSSNVAQSAEEARLGFNRMIRDTRETTKLVVAEDTRYRIWTDFNGNEVVDAAEFEYMEYAYDEATRSITLTALSAPAGGDPDLLSDAQGTLAGTDTERLSGDIEEVEPPQPVFEYVSNFLIYDADGDGQTTLDELEDAAGTGVLEGDPLEYVSDVNYAFAVSVNGSSREFYGQAQIRNRRFSDL